jgi:hypothetical protein
MRGDQVTVQCCAMSSCMTHTCAHSTLESASARSTYAYISSEAKELLMHFNMRLFHLTAGQAAMFQFVCLTARPLLKLVYSAELVRHSTKMNTTSFMPLRLKQLQCKRKSLLHSAASFADALVVTTASTMAHTAIVATCAIVVKLCVKIYIHPMLLTFMPCVSMLASSITYSPALSHKS